MKFSGIDKPAPRLVVIASIAMAFVVCALLALSATATAATATKSSSSQILYFTASAGETNVVTVTANATTLTLTDTGANITSVTGGVCTRVSSTVLTCPVTTVGTVIVRAGDKNDTITMSAAKNLHGYGSTGNDRINGGANTDNLYGEAGG